MAVLDELGPWQQRLRAQFPLIVADLRDQNRRRPTLLQAFDRAGF